MPELTFRPATLDDAVLASELMTASYPDLPDDPVLTRYFWGHPKLGYSYGRFIAELDGRPVAYVEWVHGPWEKLPERNCELDVYLDRAARTPDLAARLYGWITARAAAEGGGLLQVYAGEDEPELLAAITGLGFERERVDRVWELDLKTNGTRLIAEARQARDEAAGQGIEFGTLAAWANPNKVADLYELDRVTRKDIPRTGPYIPITLEEFELRVKLPGRRDDRCWIARDGDRPVSLSYLVFPPVRGPVATGYTATHPDYRGRGIAKAIKLQSLAQAVELGIPSVITDNDSDNAPMLHINEKLGYRLRPGFVGHVKRVLRP